MNNIIIMSRSLLLEYVDTFSAQVAIISVNPNVERAEQIKTLSKVDYLLTLIDNGDFKAHKEPIDNFIFNLPSTVKTLVIQCTAGTYRSKGLAMYISDKLDLDTPFKESKALNPIYDILMRA